MTGHDLDRLRLLDTLAVGDGQHWPDLYSNPEQQRIAEVMYGAQADELLASSWLADGERDLRAKLAAAEQALTETSDGSWEYEKRYNEAAIRGDRAEAALAAVREVLDSSEVDGPEHDDWVWLDEASRKLAEISKILAAAEQDEPEQCGHEQYRRQLTRLNPALAAQMPDCACATPPIAQPGGTE